MEKHVNEKVSKYITDFKKELVQLVGQNEIENKIRSKEGEFGIKNIHQIINFVNQYPIIQLGKDDFVKRKRVKNVVPYYDRCIAKRSNGEQCTRRKKDGETLCGTHIKGVPHGEMEKSSQTDDKVVELTYCEINGIAHYIDDNENVYHNGDVANNVKNPRIIAKYIKNVDEDGKMEISIPEIK